MPNNHLLALSAISALSMIAPSHVHAGARGVGLGVAVGGAYSPTIMGHDHTGRTSGGESLAWGFFVDIPLLETFYISPSATLYSVNAGNGRVPATDIDLNFKFIIPLGHLRLGAGVSGGVTQLDQRYNAHFGGLGYGAWSLVRNFDIFTTLQYKRLVREGPELDTLYLYAGGMFRF